MISKIKVIKTTLSVLVIATVTYSVAMVYSHSNSPYVIDSFGLPTSIEFASDNKLMALSSNFAFSEADVETRNIKRYSLNLPTPKAPSDRRVVSVNSFAFSSQKRIGGVATNMGYFLIQDGKVRPLEGSDNDETPRFAIDISSDGQLMATGENLTLWNIENKKGIVLWSVDDRRVPCNIKISPEKKFVAVGYYDGSVSMFDASQGELKWQHKPQKRDDRKFSYSPKDPRGLPGEIFSYGNPGQERFYFPMSFLADDTFIHSDGRSVSIRSSNTGELIRTIDRKKVFSLHGSANSSEIFISALKSRGPSKIEIWDARSGTLKEVLPKSGLAFDLAISPNEKIIASSEDEKLKVWHR